MKRAIFDCTLLALLIFAFGFVGMAVLEAEQDRITQERALITERYRQPKTEFSIETYLNDLNIAKVRVYTKLGKKYSYSYDLEAKDIEYYIETAAKLATVHFDTKDILDKKAIAIFELKFVDNLNDRLERHGWQVEEAKLISIETTVK